MAATLTPTLALPQAETETRLKMTYEEFLDWPGEHAHAEWADFWTLDAAGRYRPALADDQRVYRSTVLPGFWLRVDWLWTDELPDPQQAFAQIAGFPPEVVEALKALAARGSQSP